jgi:hypothetical protein
MPAFVINIDFSSFQRATNALDDGDIIASQVVREALEESTQEIIRSIETGFLKGKSPSGTRWKKNPDWWQNIKGHKKPNIGLNTQPFSVFVYPKSNKHLKDSLVYDIQEGSGGNMKSTITYQESGGNSLAHSTPLKAAILEEGGLHSFKVKNKRTGNEYSYMVNVVARSHFGLATNWTRHPFSGKDDVKMVEDIFNEHISEAMEKFANKLD